MKSIEMWRSLLYLQSLCMWSAATGGGHTLNHTRRLFSSFAAVEISKCASGGEPEVFIITLYRGKGEAFKVANWQKGWLLALSVLPLWRQREKGACEGQILLGAELAHFLIWLKEERIQFVLRVLSHTHTRRTTHTCTHSPLLIHPPYILFPLFSFSHPHTHKHTPSPRAVWVHYEYQLCAVD